MEAESELKNTVLHHRTLDTERAKEHISTAHRGLLSVPVWKLEPYTEPPLRTAFRSNTCAWLVTHGVLGAPENCRRCCLDNAEPAAYRIIMIQLAPLRLHRT